MIWLCLFFALMALYPTFIYPLCLAVLAIFYKQPPRPAGLSDPPRVTLLLVVRNGAALIEEKLANSLALDYPREHLEILVVSDGSTDATVERARSCADERIKIYELDVHSGKIAALNEAVPQARGEILLFTDVGAMLAPDALAKLAPWFQDPSVGGVCGKKVLFGATGGLGDGQAKYSRYEDLVRSCENRIASVASNEGFLYAMRKELFTPLPPAVTDDLYNAMAVVRQRKRMRYEPEATASLPVRASSSADELRRRKRIVCQSLNGIWTMRALFNPRHYGWYSWILFSHKVLRRLLPVFLAGFLFTTFALLGTNKLFTLLFWLQLFAYALALAHNRRWPLPLTDQRIAKKLVNAWSYFCLGNLGTLIGLFEFLRGKKYAKWEPSRNSR